MMKNLPTIKNNTLPEKAYEYVAEKLPAITKKTSSFGRSNSQTSLSMMSLTMMTGQSPMRQIRQILAEIEKRQNALSEAQVNHAELKKEIHDFKVDESDEISVAKFRKKNYNLQYLENKVSGSVKDIATLIRAYENIVSQHGLEDWSEEDFERAEAKHHIRRGFELLYQNLLNTHTPNISTVEYLQQFGVHIQVATAEVTGYIMIVNELIQKGNYPTATHLEDFLDEMADKYEHCVKEVSLRMFGSEDICNTDFMTTWKK